MHAGAMHVHVLQLPEPSPPPALTASLMHSDCGALLLFSGTCSADVLAEPVDLIPDHAPSLSNHVWHRDGQPLWPGKDGGILAGWEAVTAAGRQNRGSFFDCPA